MPTFQTLYTQLLSSPAPVLPPTSPHAPKPTHPRLPSDTITSLRLHPVLEALLHILNTDLPSAHFLVRHMQAAPAFEGMYAHGILHRVEGDYDNCRAWYADVCASAAFERVWGVAREVEGSVDGDEGEVKGKKVPKQKAAREFVDKIEALSKQGRGDLQSLEVESRREIDTLVQFCVEKFGTGRCEDATKVWVQPSDEIRSKGQDMVTGNDGFRKF